MDKPIIQTTFLAIRSGGERVKLIVQIGQPYRCGNDPDSWACPIAILPDYTHLRDIVGGDPLQSLCLGTQMVLDLLDGYRVKGEKLTFDGKSEVPLNAYGFQLPQRNA